MINELNEANRNYRMALENLSKADSSYFIPADMIAKGAGQIYNGLLLRYKLEEIDNKIYKLQSNLLTEKEMVKLSKLYEERKALLDNAEKEAEICKRQE